MGEGDARDAFVVTGAVAASQVGRVEAEQWGLMAEHSRQRESERSEVLAIKRLQYTGVPQSSSTGKLLLEMHARAVSPPPSEGAALRLGHTQATTVAPTRAGAPLSVEDYDD